MTKKLLIRVFLSLRTIEFIGYLQSEGTYKDPPSLPLSYNYFHFLPTGKESTNEAFVLHL